jgi:hypothetical protein
VTANKTSTLDLALVPWSSIAGRVVDDATSKPMGELVVLAYTEGPADFGDLAMGILSGDGPKTGVDGKFRIDKLAAGKGAVAILDGDAEGFQVVAMRDFVLDRGQHLDLGELRGIAASTIPKAERGELGLETDEAVWANRPLADGQNAEDDPPAGLDPEAEHLWISEVEADGPASKAGLARGDRIVSVGGAAVELIGRGVVEQLLSPMRVRAGDSVTIEVERAGERKSYTVTAVVAGT